LLEATIQAEVALMTEAEDEDEERMAEMEMVNKMRRESGGSSPCCGDSDCEKMDEESSEEEIINLGEVVPASRYSSINRFDP